MSIQYIFAPVPSITGIVMLFDINFSFNTQVQIYYLSYGYVLGSQFDKGQHLVVKFNL